jgi:tellurite resistance protein TerC
MFWAWVGFNAVVVVLLVLDLVVFHRHSHVIKVKEALLWSAFWIALALVFNVGLYFTMDADHALKFFTGYVLEKSLSVDNLFVFLLIFSYFKVPAQYQHNVLFWGILGALVMRAIFIFCGVALLHHFHWVIYVFGAFLVFTGFKLVFEKEKEVDPSKNPVLKLFRRFMPVTAGYEGDRFFVRHAGRLHATPLFIVLLVVETTDVVFAVDSIPAILAITTDSFIVYTSNVFAILGLRALYFALAGLMGMFRYLHYGLGAILAFVGVKMLIADFYKIPIGLALGVIAGILALTILVSLRETPPEDLDKKKIRI